MPGLRRLAGNHPANALAQFIARLDRRVLPGPQGRCGQRMAQNRRTGELAQFGRITEMVGVTVRNHDQAEVLRLQLQGGELAAVFLEAGRCAGVDEYGALVLNERGIGKAEFQAGNPGHGKDPSFRMACIGTVIRP